MTGAQIPQIPTGPIEEFPAGLEHASHAEVEDMLHAALVNAGLTLGAEDAYAVDVLAASPRLAWVVASLVERARIGGGAS